MYYLYKVISSYPHYNDFSGQKATMKVIGGGEETPLSLVRHCRMRVQSFRALYMSESLHLTIGYLLRDKHNNLESKLHGWLVNVRG